MYRLYQLGVRIDLAPSLFFRTKMITIAPRFVLVNNTDLNLHYKQKGTISRHDIHGLLDTVQTDDVIITSYRRGRGILLSAQNRNTLALGQP